MISTLFIFTDNPYTSRKSADGLEAVMAACAMEFEVKLLLLHDAVWSIKTSQRPPSAIKPGFKTFAALGDFGVEQIYAYQHSLIGRGLVAEDLSVGVQECNRDEIASLIARHERVLVF